MSPPLTATPVEHDLTGRLAALICADRSLLDAEFDAIVAAAWPTPPPPGEGIRTTLPPRRP